MQRKQHVEPRAFFQGEHAGGNFVNRIFLDLAAALRAIRVPDAGKEQAQIVVDFGCRCHRGARVAGLVLLANRDRRRDAVDQIGVGLFDALQKLPGIGRQRFHVAALAFGVNRVKGERRLARARDPGHDGQAVVRDFKVDVLEIVNASPAHDDGFVGHAQTIDPSFRQRTSIAEERLPCVHRRGQPENPEHYIINCGGAYEEPIRTGARAERRSWICRGVANGLRSYLKNHSRASR